MPSPQTTARVTLLALAMLALLATMAGCQRGGPDPSPTPTPELEGYEPPHNEPGPSSEILRFRSFHVDLAASEVQAGRADMYIFSLKTEAARALRDQQDVRLYEAPATMTSLVLNPAPAPQGQLNPFSLPEVRFALQYSVNRDFIAQEIYQGLAAPMVAHVGPFDFDYLTVFDVIREYNFTYDPDRAADMVNRAMTGAGAELRDGVWHYNNRPVQLRFLIRIEDERRDIGDLVRVELENLGFMVTPAYHEFAPAVLTVYGTDPALLQWHLYTEGWGRGAAERYDAGTINQMYVPWLGNMPGWQEVGYWQYEHPRLDELGMRIFQGDFQGPEERDGLYREATRLGIEESVRVWLATGVNSFPARSTIRGITEDLTSGPRSIWSLREAHVPGQDTLTLGNLWVWTERTIWNPVGGFGDVYSVDIWRNLHDPPTARHPFTGNPVSFRAHYEVETAGPQAKLEVPSDAVLWDAQAGAFRPVGSGVQATSKVLFDYSQYFRSQWHHGQPITMADVMYSVFQSFDLAYSDHKSRIEFARAVTSRPYLETFRGFRVVDDELLEVYVDFWHFVPDYIAEYASPSGLSMPWEVLAAMDRVVFEDQRAAYSDTAAARYGVPWLSLVMSRDARMVRNALRDFQDDGFVPEAPFQLGDRSLVTPEEAEQRYRAAREWFDQYDMLVISNGPYMLVRYDPPAQFAELHAFRDPTYPFRPGDWYHGRATTVAITRVEEQGITAGRQASVDVTLDGPGNLSLRYVLFDPASGESVLTGQATPDGGAFRIRLAGEETTGLAPGLHHLFLLAASDESARPTERRVDVRVTAP